MRLFKISARAALWAFFAIILGYIIYQAVAPGGRISYVNDFSKQSYFISEIGPDSRTEARTCGIAATGGKECWQRIAGEPAYFNLRTPRNFENALVRIKFRTDAGSSTADRAPLIEIGILRDKLLKRYELKPIENGTIDRLAREWDVVRENEVMLLQKEKKFLAVADFLAASPSADQISAYNYEFKPDFKLAGYAPGGVEYKIVRSLRGAYQLYTYIKEETMDFSFSLLDINKDTIHDKADITVYFLDEPIYSRSIDGDENDSDNGSPAGIGVHKIRIPDLPEGAYKIELRANDDIVTESIATRQSKLALAKRFWLAGLANGKEPAVGSRAAEAVYTDSRIVHFNTTNPASLQAVDIDGGKKLDINATFKQFSAKTGSRPAKIVLEKTDIILAGDGFFAFDPEALFNPLVRKADGYLDAGEDNINYVLASYSTPEEKGGWKYAEARFDLGPAYRENQQYGFIISMPGLKADDDIRDWLDIGEIRIDLAGKTLSDKIQEIFQ